MLKAMMIAWKILRFARIDDVGNEDSKKPVWAMRRTWGLVIAAIGGVLYYKYGVTLEGDNLKLVFDGVAAITSGAMILYGVIMEIVGVINKKKAKDGGQPE